MTTTEHDRELVAAPPSIGGLLDGGVDVTTTVQQDRLNEAFTELGAAEPGSAAFADASARIRDLSIRIVSDRIDLHRHFDLSWPKGLYVPVDAPASDWPFIGTPQRYAQAWTTNGPGFATASEHDGSLVAAALAPSVQGTIEGALEAGIGVRYTATAPLARVRVQPTFVLDGLVRYDAHPIAGVFVHTDIVGEVQVGGFELNPVTNGWEPIRTSPWRRYEVFRFHDVGSNTYAPQTTPFSRSGDQASADVLVEGGKTYLLSVVARAWIKVVVERDGQPVHLTGSTSFDITGSVHGRVTEIWLAETPFG